MSDRIAVMNEGVVEQVARPHDLYEHPASAFVAGFIGTSNLVKLRVDAVTDGLIEMHLGEGERIVAPAPDGAVTGAATQITVRPEKVKVSDGSGEARCSRVSGTVADVVYLGSMTQLMVDLRTGDRLVVHRLNDDLTSDPTVGAQVVLQWAPEHSFVIAGATNGEATAGAAAS